MQYIVTKTSSKIILVQVYIIFALPDYSSEVIERHQNFIHLALEFDIHYSGRKQIQRQNREKPYIILNHNNHYAGLQKIKEGALLGLEVQ